MKAFVQNKTERLFSYNIQWLVYIKRESGLTANGQVANRDGIVIFVEGL